MDSSDREEAKLTKIYDAKIWTQILIKDGAVVEINHNKEWDKFEKFSEILVVCDDSENIMPFIEQSMMVVVAHTQRYMDDIVEAYLFRELHDLAY
jgi:predicted GTPase